MSSLSYTEVSEILGLIDRIDCDSMTLEYGDLRISVRRGASAGLETTSPATASPPDDAAVEPVSADATTRERGGAAEGTDTPDGWVSVTAPMIGTFFRHPAPGEAPFVEVGDRVEAGQTVGLIEVMKLYSELKAESAGTVARIDAEDTALVEYGQPLVWIDPSGEAA
jgi:acetyl-CoA carboxylase biotin carboxyl carrier protein